MTTVITANDATSELRQTQPLSPPPWRQGFLRCLMAALFFLFFQASMVAPLIPHMAEKFQVSRATMGLIIPGYLLPYALGTFAYGLLADRFGRRGVLFACIPAFACCCLLTATAHAMPALIFWRIAAGAAGGGIAVVSLTFIGDMFAVEERGHALGWAFGAIAGGMAFGSSLGGMLTPLIGWRGLFVSLGFFSLLPLFPLACYWQRLATSPLHQRKPTAKETLRNYARIAGSVRGRKTYLYILLNGIYNSGTFTWLGSYLTDRHHLSEAGIGLVLLGYGVPGFLLGPWIGKMVDRYGRGKLLPWGFVIAALSGAALILQAPLVVAAIAITFLSFGFDMSHPLLAGIVSTLSTENRGQAMGLNTFTLFLGLSLGSLLFGWGMQHWGFAEIMGVFAAAQFGLGLLATLLFRSE